MAVKRISYARIMAVAAVLLPGVAVAQLAPPAVPTGAATAANQATANTALGTIVTNTTGAATAANQATANTTLGTIATNTTGASTAANQSTEITNLSAINTSAATLAGAVSSAKVLTATVPNILTIVALDVATVTTGGTAVTALSAGHRNRGGWMQNPKGAVDLCINEQGTASGTTSAGATTCIVGGQIYNLTPSGNAVSVISSDSSHPYSGQGYN